MRWQQIIDLLDSLTFRRGRWFDFETDIIDHLLRSLKPEAARVLKCQLGSIRHIHRGRDYREINLYFSRDGNVENDGTCRFRNKAEQLHLATMKVSYGGSEAQLKTDFWIVDGRLFEISYGEAPKTFFKTKDLYKVVSHVVDIKIWSDPMEEDSEKRSSSLQVTSAKDAGILLGIESVRNLRPPFPLNSIETELTKWEVTFPADYLEFLALTDGCDTDFCEILGLKSIRQISFEKELHLILAEAETVGVLTIGPSSNGSEIFFIDYINDTSTRLGSNFANALSTLRATVLAR